MASQQCRLNRKQVPDKTSVSKRTSQVTKDGFSASINMRADSNKSAKQATFTTNTDHLQELPNKYEKEKAIGKTAKGLSPPVIGRRGDLFVAHCASCNCFKAWSLKKKHGDEDIIPLTINGTMDMHAKWPNRCRNIIASIRKHYEQFHPNEEIPFAAQRKGKWHQRKTTDRTI